MGYQYQWDTSVGFKSKLEIWQAVDQSLVSDNAKGRDSNDVTTSTLDAGDSSSQLKISALTAPVQAKVGT